MASLISKLRPSTIALVKSVFVEPAEIFRNAPLEFSSILGVMTYDGEAMPLAGMGIARNFSREFSCQAQVSFSRLNH